MGVTELRFLETTAHWVTVILDGLDGCQGGCQMSVSAIIALHSFRVCVILQSLLSFAVISSSLPFPLLLYPPPLHFYILSSSFLIWLLLCAERLLLTFIMPSVSLDLLCLSLFTLTVSSVLGLNMS
jgi:hypothetical protein